MFALFVNLALKNVGFEILSQDMSCGEKREVVLQPQSQPESVQTNVQNRKRSKTTFAPQSTCLLPVQKPSLWLVCHRRLGLGAESSPAARPHSSEWTSDRDREDGQRREHLSEQTSC